MKSQSLCLIINPKYFEKIVFVLLNLCRHSLKHCKELTRYLLNHRRRFMYLQTLGFLMSQRSKVPKKNLRTFSTQHLSRRTFCNDGNVLATCGYLALKIWLLNKEMHFSLYLILNNLKLSVSMTTGSDSSALEINIS